MNTLIKNAYVILPDMSVKKADIAVSGDSILAVDDIPADFSADKTIDGSDHLAMPGLVNAHTHASMTLLRSYADDMELMDWLTKKIWPIEDKMSAEDIYWGAALAMVEMIKSGTTTFADMYGPYMEKVAEATIEAGLRGVLSRGLIGVAPDCDAKLAEGESLYRDFHGAADGRITVMLAPHAPYTCPPDYLRKVAAKAQALGAEIHIHMSETLTEVKNCLKDYGKRPFAHVESTGIFESGTLAAHCVHLDEEDIAIIKKHHIRVAHNPGSNMKLASGVAPVPHLLKEGICVALGTDGASSNNNLDMLEEVRLAALLHKVHQLDPLAVSAAEAVRMGTEYGAKAVGYQDVGRLEAGYKADIVLLSLRDPAWHPQHNFVSLLAYSANSGTVDTVMVGGRLLMENRQILTLDEEKIYAEAGRCIKQLWER